MCLGHSATIDPWMAIVGNLYWAALGTNRWGGNRLRFTWSAYSCDVAGLPSPWYEAIRPRTLTHASLRQRAFAPNPIAFRCGVLLQAPRTCTDLVVYFRRGAIRRRSGQLACHNLSFTTSCRSVRVSHHRCFTLRLLSAAGCALQRSKSPTFPAVPVRSVSVRWCLHRAA